MIHKFKLKSDFKPTGDQPKAIKALAAGLKKGLRKQTLLGATGTGKTFTVANVIEKIQKPTLVIAHNKTLAAQLAAEYKQFFPDNAVHYFVSYYDYYQPEAYMPITDTYIEKDAQINKEIDRLRHAATQALLTRRDVIVVASVSCIYGLGSPEEYREENMMVEEGMKISRGDLLQKLISLFYERTNADLFPGSFRAIGNKIEVMPVSEKNVYSIELGRKIAHQEFANNTRSHTTEGGGSPGVKEQTPGVDRASPGVKESTPGADSSRSIISNISKIDPVSSKILDEPKNFFLFPAKHFLTPKELRERAISAIKRELNTQLKKFEREGKVLEAERLKRRTNYDIAMIREVGYCSGIENYSRHLSGRSAGAPPETLLSYFPQRTTLGAGRSHSRSRGGSVEWRRGESPGVDRPLRESRSREGQGVNEPDFLTIIDESHVTLPQIQGMYAGDRSRKKTLVEHGFRLPSALDNRPLKYEEFEERIGQVIYTSATPAEFERRGSQKIVEQIIRPTGLVDPKIEVKPITGGLSPHRGLSPQGRGLEGTVPPQLDTRTAETAPPEHYPGQVQDFITEATREIKKGNRVIATTLTKKMAEDLASYLKEGGRANSTPGVDRAKRGSLRVSNSRSHSIKAEYLHSEVKTIERIKVLTDFRKGKFDILVGVNLLREGLDLPEVSLIGILDADKEGFLRSETSLIQIIGRAARNAAGRVILYADEITGSMQRAIDETNRRRKIQIAYNKKHGITPKTIKKKVSDITEAFESLHDKSVKENLSIDMKLFERNPKKFIKQKERQMAEAVKELDFESAAIIRDELKILKEKI